MLTILGQNRAGNFCNRATRRGFLKIGSLALGGLSMPDILRAEAASGTKSHKSIIMIFLPGGPPHQDIATLYHRLGIDAGHTTVNDLGGRPQYIADHYLPIGALI